MYKKNKKDWNKLDNAAKIFPCTSNRRDTKVFRFACQLKENVDPDLLQQSTDISLNMFPMFKVIMRKGVFWFYFEDTDLSPVVFCENIPACSPLYDVQEKKLLFRVSYFNNRINLEIHHSLTDGTGALQFLKTIVSNYLQLAHSDEFLNETSNIDYDATYSQRREDSFTKYYIPKNGKKAKTQKAYKIRGKNLPEGRIKIIEGICSVKEILAIAKKYNTTMTVYMCAIMLLSIRSQMSSQDLKRPVVMSVPVNLRNFFYSKTARNFFGTMDISYDFSKNSDKIEDIIEHVKSSFDTILTEENMLGKLCSYAKLEKNIFVKLLPLSLKNIILKAANRNLQSTTSATISNIGKIAMPIGMEQYISHFSVFISTVKVQFCVCSFEDNLTVSFTSAFEDTDIQKNFFRTLTSEGIEVNILSNEIIN